MRRVLVEHARAAKSQKRGGGLTRITLNEDLATVSDRTIEILHLDQVLTALEQRNARQSKVAELRLFAGLSYAEISQVLDVSERTVYGDWRMARAWISRELGSDRA